MLSRSLAALIESRRSLRDVGGDVGLGLRSKDTSSHECETCGCIVPPSLMRKDARGGLCCPECRQPRHKQSDLLLQRGDILPPCDGAADVDAPGRTDDDAEDLLSNAEIFWGRRASEPAPRCRSSTATVTRSTHQASKVATLPRRRRHTIAGDDEGGIWQRSASEDVCAKSAPTMPAAPAKRPSSKLSVFSFSTPVCQATRSSSVSQVSTAGRMRRNSTGSIVPPQMKQALATAQSPSEYRRIQRIMTAELAIAG